MVLNISDKRYTQCALVVPPLQCSFPEHLTANVTGFSCSLLSHNPGNKSPGQHKIAEETTHAMRASLEKKMHNVLRNKPVSIASLSHLGLVSSACCWWTDSLTLNFLADLLDGTSVSGLYFLVLFKVA